MADYVYCPKCRMRHAIPRFEELQLQRPNPCDREPRLLADVVEGLLAASNGAQRFGPDEQAR